MSTSHDCEFPEHDSMTIDPANLGSVDPFSVEGICLVALSKYGTERDTFLSVQCVDPSQRQRVEGLLVAYEQAGNFLQKPAVSSEPVPIGQYLAPCELPCPTLTDLCFFSISACSFRKRACSLESALWSFPSPLCS